MGVYKARPANKNVSGFVLSILRMVQSDWSGRIERDGYFSATMKHLKLERDRKRMLQGPRQVSDRQPFRPVLADGRAGAQSV